MSILAVIGIIALVIVFAATYFATISFKNKHHGIGVLIIAGIISFIVILYFVLIRIITNM